VQNKTIVCYCKQISHDILSDTYYSLFLFIENKTMTSISYTTLLFNWFRVHIPFSQKPNITPIPRTGYAAAYPEIKRHHRRQSNLFSCLPLIYKSKKNNKTQLLNNNQSKINKKTSGIKGCASFARFDTYEEGETDDDC
jgi:hypothetical protein